MNIPAKLTFEYKRTYEYGELQELAISMCTREPILNFSMFNTKEGAAVDGVWRVHAPDIESYHPVIDGKVQFMTAYWRVTDEPLYSRIVENPTWRVIIDIFNTMLQNGDRQGIYLEGLNVVEVKDDIKIVLFQIGS